MDPDQCSVRVFPMFVFRRAVIRSVRHLFFGDSRMLERKNLEVGTSETWKRGAPKAVESGLIDVLQSS